jgi:hypothetical protein
MGQEEMLGKFEGGSAMLLMNTTTVYKSDDPPSGEQLMKSN